MKNMIHPNSNIGKSIFEYAIDNKIKTFRKNPEVIALQRRTGLLNITLADRPHLYKELAYDSLRPVLVHAQQEALKILEP